jgi:AcrR family transcriptional regulator
VARSPYRRLTNDDRRAQLLASAVEQFAEHGYDELSMSAIARAAGISKPLLYHYFPSKQRLFEAALSQGAQEHLARVAPDAELPPADRVRASLDAFVGWIAENPGAYEKLMRSAGIPEVRELIDRVRAQTAGEILGGLGLSDPPPARVRAAVRGWLTGMDGVLLDWVEHGDMTREEVRDLLLGTFAGALTAAGVDVAAALG